MPRQSLTARQRKPRRARRVFIVLLACAVLAAAAYAANAAFRGPAARPSVNKDRPSSQPPPQSVTPSAVTDPNAPLQELLDRLVAAKGDYAIAVAEPDGRHANTNGDKQYTAASTYKLFIAYGVFQSINRGDMQWSDPIFGGWDAQECLKQMIVVSNNDCPEAFGNLIGWQNIDDEMDALGLHNTRVKFHDNATTANDLALYLSKLLDNSLLNADDTQTLLGYMKQQIYRKGIPAGTGVTVADKVGFLYALLHDAGIVYGAKGPYVLVIMSNNSSWSQLADAARQVHNLLEQ